MFIVEELAASLLSEEHLAQQLEPASSRINRLTINSWYKFRLSRSIDPPFIGEVKDFNIGADSFIEAAVQSQARDSKRWGHSRLLRLLRRTIRLSVMLYGVLFAMVRPMSAAPLPDKLFIFGDSYSDAGASHVDGNEPTAFAYLAEDLDLQLAYPGDPDSCGKSLDFATSDAPSGLAEGQLRGGRKFGVGMRSQIQHFANEARTGKITFVPPTTLFLLAGGLNDQYSSTESTINNLKDEIRTLAELGALHIQVALLPESIPAFHDVSSRLNLAIENIPQELSTELPNTEIQLSRWGTYFDAAMSSPAKFGVTATNVNDRSTAVQKIIGDKLYLDLLADGTKSDRGDPITSALSPFWIARRQTEPILPIKNDPARPAHAKLLFMPSRVYGAQGADGETIYKEGRDFIVDKSDGTVILTQASRTPYRMKNQLALSISEGKRLFGATSPNISPGIFFSEGAIYEGFQTYIDYSFAPHTWRGYTPRFAGKHLPRTLARLRNHQDLHVLVIGDSISAGYSASSHLNAPPRKPGYAIRVAAGLQRVYKGNIYLDNISVPGWRASQGLKQVRASHVADTRPDLTIIAFGMNDVGLHDPSGYRNNILGMIHEIRKISPETEFILIAPMIGNRNWPPTPIEQFLLYRDQLASLTGDGVVMLDMTTMWQQLLQRKTFFDLTGNGLNHPNDFGHRLYAQALLSLLVNMR
jgi:acyl-CoA thioesterase-1